MTGATIVDLVGPRLILAPESSQTDRQKQLATLEIVPTLGKLRPAINYETEARRFESCRARLPKAVDSAQRWEVLPRWRNLPHRAETAVPVLKSNQSRARAARSPEAASSLRGPRWSQATRPSRSQSTTAIFSRSGSPRESETRLTSP